MMCCCYDHVIMADMIGLCLNSVVIALVVRPKKTSVLPVALPKKVGTGGICFFFNYFYFQFLAYFPELRDIKS